MASYVLRRLLVAIPTILIIITIAFFMMRAAPGNPFDLERPMAEAIRQRILAEYNLDQHVILQYFNYMGDLLRGDLGPSMTTRDKDVAQLIMEAAPTSALVGVSALILAIFVGGALGVAAALRQNKPGDYMAMAIALIGISIPPFVVGPLLQLFILTIVNPEILPFIERMTSIEMRPIPTAGPGVGGLDLTRFVLPVITLALPQIAIISRLMRASMIEVVRSNYIRTARAKGVSGRRVVLRHALQAALPPVVSYIGPAAAALVTGSLVVEQIFALPGIGRMFIERALTRDYTVVMGVVIIYSTLIILLNLLADLVLAVLDPKVRFE